MLTDIFEEVKSSAWQEFNEYLLKKWREEIGRNEYYFPRNRDTRLLVVNRSRENIF